MSDTEAYFKSRLSFEPKRDKIWKPIVQYLQRYIPENAKILELGAGYCSFINQVKGSERHALDRAAIVRKSAAADVTVHVRDCRNLSTFETDYFDVVFSSFLYEHLTRRDLDRVMAQLRRILRTDGILITLLPNFKLISRHYFDDYTHIQVFSHISFADYLTAQGFSVEVVQGRFIPYSFKSRFPKSALLTRLYLTLPWRPFAGNMLIVAKNPEYTPPPKTGAGNRRRPPRHSSKNSRGRPTRTIEKTDKSSGEEKRKSDAQRSGRRNYRRKPRATPPRKKESGSPE